MPVGSEKGTANPPATAKQTPLKPGARTVVLARAGDKPYDKTFDDLRFDIQPGQPFHREMLPQPIEALARPADSHSRLHPADAAKARDQDICPGARQPGMLLRPGAALYDCILVEMKPGKTAEYTIRPVAVEGTFGIEEVKSGDMHLAIYHLDAESVRETEQIRSAGRLHPAERPAMSVILPFLVAAKSQLRQPSSPRLTGSLCTTAARTVRLAF